MQSSYEYPIYGLDFHPTKPKLVAASFIEKLENEIVITENIDSQLVRVSSLAVEYPVTKALWQPIQASNDLFATTGDYFRLYEVVSPDLGSHDQLLICRATMQNVRRVGSNSQEMYAPLTSFDWNLVDPSLCVTCSVDTTCSVWDMNTQQAKTQLIAHDSEVLDVAFANGVHVFSSVGSDGSVRMFDQRTLAHSTIMYESTPVTKAGKPPALMRLDWNKKDSNYLATFQQDGLNVVILDIRVPAVPVFEMKGHERGITAISWSPVSQTQLCAVGKAITYVGDDGNALIWDMTKTNLPTKQYFAGEEIANMCWRGNNPNSLTIAYGNTVKIVPI